MDPKNLLLDDTVILGEKLLHKGALHGMVGVGGTVPCGDLFGVRFWLSNENFVMLQVVSKGVKSKLRYSMTRPGKKKEVEQLAIESTTEVLF